MPGEKGLNSLVSGMCGSVGHRGFWELGGDKDAGRGNGCIFNGRESKGPGVRPRVSSCIIDQPMDTETESVCGTHTHIKRDSHTPSTPVNLSTRVSRR